ncbi:O-methyltransferase-domain-containing protein [Mycena leptocephala]|nr:O-methyltransferase-domain-containing protein [Mycena leptocephala]
MNPPSTIWSAFPWACLPEGAVVIDVGGGIGSAALLLAQKHPHLRIIVQDLLEVAINAQKSWEVQFPEVNQSNQVAFEGHDFFKPQPVHNASVFFLRYIVHNWSDPAAPPLLPNFGAVNALGHSLDSLATLTFPQMLNGPSGISRSCGWQLQQVVRIEGSGGFYQQLRGVPAWLV